MPLKPADLHILLALSKAPLHGYGLMKEVEAESFGEVRLELGSLYRLLGRLMDEGLIRCAGEDERRRLYSLTPLGHAALKSEAQRLAELMKLIRARKLLSEAES
ncbi:MAG TPA: helix-turn-helix transcriptional regulator [Bryobacteraceae bacterium]|nr:helix-turn-helix transcriptional regulator [Bryobacteraceae bacterium]